MNPNPTSPDGRPRRARINAAVAGHMTSQAGLISYAQLLACGHSPRTIARRVAAGELVLRNEPAPPRRRRHSPSPPAVQKRFKTQAVYGAHESPLGLNGVRWAAVLGGPNGCRLSHVSACALLDLDRQRGQIMHVIHLGNTWHPPKGVVGHRTTHLPEADCIEVNGIPGTGLARSLLDAAADISADRLDDLLDRAVEINIYDELALDRVRRERPTVRGVTRLSEAISRLDGQSGTFRSNFERRTTRLVQTSTLIPSPVVNVLLKGFRPDLLFVGTRAIIECDGRDYHRSLAQIASDEERERILRALGFRFLRLRWSQVVYEEERTLERIERFVLANQAPPVPGR